MTSSPGAQKGSSQMIQTSLQATVTTIGGTSSVTIPLQRSPWGTLALTWEKSLGILALWIDATGLALNSSHPILVYGGSCAHQNGQVLPYQFNPLKANALGDGPFFEQLEHIQSLPASGQWSLDIYNGPHLLGDPNGDALQAMPIACVTITTVHDRIGNQFASSLPLVGPFSRGRPLADQNVTGKAQVFFIVDGPVNDGSVPISITKVVIQVRGVAFNSTHMAHIHAGSCQEQGRMLAPLTPVINDPSGNGLSVTTLSPPLETTSTTQLYINIHEAATPLLLQVSQGFDPISCGSL
jgi:hypothetical protein